MSTATTKAKILYVEDDEDDFLVFSETLASEGSGANLIGASDGEEAIKMLQAAADEDLPSLIILDLNMPKWDGARTLQFLKTDPHFSNIPVVILTTSENRKDKEICAEIGAATFYQKPFHIDGYRTIVKNLIPLLRNIS